MVLTVGPPQKRGGLPSVSARINGPEAQRSSRVLITPRKRVQLPHGPLVTTLLFRYYELPAPSQPPMRRFGDYAGTRQSVFANALSAIKALPPVENSRYRLQITDPVYQGPEVASLADHKNALLEGRSLSRRIVGNYNLIDKATNTIVDSKRATIAAVPTLTHQGVFVIDGSASALSHQLRLLPGIYARRKQNGAVEAHVNVMPGGGVPHRINLEPETGVFRVSVGQAEIPAINLLKTLGATDDELKSAWGQKLYEVNKKYDKPHYVERLYEKFGPAGKIADGTDIAAVIRDRMSKYAFDPWVMKRTTNHPHTTYGKESLLTTTRKLLDIANNRAEPDDRDNPAYYTVWGPEHLIAERLARSGTVLQKFLWQATNTNSLQKIPTGLLTPTIKALFTKSGLSQNPEGVNSLEFMDHGARITKVGEGGIGRSADAIPDSARWVNSGQLPFIDLVRTAECYDEKTEVMTKTGWKFWSEVTHDDELACLIDGRLEYHQPTKLVAEPYTGVMYGAKARHVDYLVTSNHRMYVQKFYKNAPNIITTAHEVHECNIKHTSAGHLPYVGVDMSLFTLPEVKPEVANVDDCESDESSRRSLGTRRLKTFDPFPIAPFLELLGWYLGEGSTRIRRNRGVENNYTVLISQSKNVNPHKCLRIEKCLEQLNLPVKYYQSCRAYIVNGKQLVEYLAKFGYSQQRYIPKEFFDAPAEARRRLFEALLLAEGSMRKSQNGYGHFSTTSEQLANDFILLAFSLGYSTTLTTYKDPRKESYSLTYRVTIHSRTIREVRKADRRNNEDKATQYYTENYDGMVYCASVPGGLVYVRRNGCCGFWCGNSESVGIDNRIAFGTRLGADKQIYAPLRDARTNKIVFKSPKDVADSVLAFPNVHATNDLVVPAIIRGKMGYAPRHEIDYIIPHMEQSFSPLTNLVPMKSSSKAHRSSMGSRMITQALPLVNAEAPLVRAAVPGQPHKSFEELFGPHTGSVYARNDQPGMVTDVQPGFIKVKYADGTEQTHEKYDNHPSGRKTSVNTIPLVKPGDQIQPGQLLARSNYTDASGHAAYGLNTRVAFMNLKGITYEDGMAVSQSYADRMKSDHLYRHSVDHDETTKVGKVAHLAAFPGKYKLDVLRNMSDDGLVKPGTVVKSGDPLILAIKQKQGQYGRLSRSGAASYSDASEVWEHDEPGLVTDVVNTKHGPVVLVKTEKSVKHSDKLCYDPQTEVLTSMGWKPVADVTPLDEVASLNETGYLEYVHPVAVHNYPHAGEMYSLETTQVSLLVTPDHSLYAKRSKVKPYALIPAKELYGKTYRLQSNALWMGEDPETITLENSGYTRKIGQGGVGTKDVPPVVLPAELYMMFLGIYLTDGHVVYQPDHGTYALAVTQVKPKHREKLINALKDQNINYTENKTNSQLLIHSRGLAEHFRLIGKTKDKHIPNGVFKLSARLLKILHEWMIWGNGSVSTTTSFYTGSQRLVGDYQRLCLYIGYAARVATCLAEDKPDCIKGVPVKTKSDSYVAYTYLKKTNPEINHSHAKEQGRQKEEWVQYDGRVYCVSLPKNHVLYVRRNGRPIWCGNSGKFGNKGVVTVVPDNEMPVDSKGRPIEMVISALGTVSRINPSAIFEAHLGKIAAETGRPYIIDDFQHGQNMGQFVENEARKHNIPFLETLTDPKTGRQIPNVGVGVAYMMKLHHMAESKVKGRGLGGYDETGQPLRGQSGKAMRSSMGDSNALLSHGATKVIHDAHMFKGQSNPEFWLSYMSGYPATRPTQSKAFDRFLTELRAAAINPVRDPQGRIHLTALTNKDIHSMAGSRVVDNGETLDFSKHGKPYPGGLFDERIFGAADSTTSWAKIPLHEPIPNPVFEDPIRKLLNLTQQQYRDTIQGKYTLPTGTGTQAIVKALQSYDLDKEIAKARKDYQSSRKTVKDLAYRKLGYLKTLEDQKRTPADWVIDALPVLPPAYRPVSAGGSMGVIVHDANLTYKDAIEANNALKELHGQIADVGAERLNVYDAAKAVIGLGEPVNAKNRERGVKGILERLLGSSSKYSYVQQKLLGTPIDLSGRGSVLPNPDLDMDQIGIPESMAWDVYHPFIVRRLVRSGMGRVDAARAVQEQQPVAKRAMLEELNSRPVLATRYPALHRYNTQGFHPVLVSGDAIQTNSIINKSYTLDHDGDQQLNTIFVVFAKQQLDSWAKEHNISVSPYRNFWEHTEMSARFRTSVVMDKIKAIPQVGTNSYSCHCINLQDFPRGDLIGEKGHISYYQVPPGVFVIAYDEHTRQPRLAEVEVWTEHKDREVEIVTLESGRQIVTDDDPRAVYGLDVNTYQMVRRRPEMSIGVFVPRVDRINFDNEHVADATFQDDTSGEIFNVQLTREFGYLCGVLVGNGWVSNTHPGCRQLHLSCTDPGVDAAYRDALSKTMDVHHIGTTQVRTQGDASGFGASRRLTLSDTFLGKVFRNLIGHGARHKHLPPFFLTANSDFRSGLLSGLIDTDGSVAFSGAKNSPQLLINYTSSSVRLIQETQHLCRSLGIYSSVTAQHTPRGDDFWLLNISTPDVQRHGLTLHHTAKSRNLATAAPAATTTSGYLRNHVIPIHNKVAHAARRATLKDKQASDHRANYQALTRALADGYLSRLMAERVVERYPQPELGALWDAFVAITRDKSTVWDKVVSYEKTGIRETGYDLTVPGYETFMSVDGVILSNTMTISVPLSDEAVKETYDKLMPSKNLFSPATMKATNFLPNMEYVQGLHAASTMDEKNDPIVFHTKQEAVNAYKSGKISLGTRVRILES